jgi:hypothetical protein
MFRALIEKMDPLNNHGTYSTPGMKKPRNFIFNPTTMNDSNFPQVGLSMWLSTRTVLAKGEAYVEPYRFLLDKDDIDRTRSFIAPQSFMDPISHLFSEALLLIGDFDPEIIIARGPEAVTLIFDHTDLVHFGHRVHDLSAEFSLDKILEYTVLKYQMMEDAARADCFNNKLGPEETNDFLLDNPSLAQICGHNSFFRHLSPSTPLPGKLTILVNPIKMLGGEVKLASSNLTSADFADWANRFMDTSPWAHKVTQLLIIRPVPLQVKMDHPNRSYSHNDSTDGPHARGFFKGSLALVGSIRFGFPNLLGEIDYKGAAGVFTPVILGYSTADLAPFSSAINAKGLVGHIAIPLQASQPSCNLSAFRLYKGIKSSPPPNHALHLALFHPNQLTPASRKGLEAFRVSAFRVMDHMPISPTGSQGFFLYPQSTTERDKFLAYFGDPRWGGIFMVVPLSIYLSGGTLEGAPLGADTIPSELEEGVPAFDGVRVSFFRGEYSGVVLRELFHGLATFFPIDRRTLCVQHPSGPTFIQAVLAAANIKLKEKTVPASAYSPLFYSTEYAVHNVVPLSPHPCEASRKRTWSPSPDTNFDQTAADDEEMAAPVFRIILGNISRLTPHDIILAALYHFVGGIQFVEFARFVISKHSVTYLSIGLDSEESLELALSQDPFEFTSQDEPDFIFAATFNPEEIHCDLADYPLAGKVILQDPIEISLPNLLESLSIQDNLAGANKALYIQVQKVKDLVPDVGVPPPADSCPPSPKSPHKSTPPILPTSLSSSTSSSTLSSPFSSSSSSSSSFSSSTSSSSPSTPQPTPKSTSSNSTNTNTKTTTPTTTTTTTTNTTTTTIIHPLILILLRILLCLLLPLLPLLPPGPALQLPPPHTTCHPPRPDPTSVRVRKGPRPPPRPTNHPSRQKL